MGTGYAELPNELVSASNGSDYAYRYTGGGEGAVPLVLLQHFLKQVQKSRLSILLS